MIAQGVVNVNLHIKHGTLMLQRNQHIDVEPRITLTTQAIFQGQRSSNRPAQRQRIGQRALLPGDGHQRPFRANAPVNFRRGIVIGIPRIAAIHQLD